MPTKSRPIEEILSQIRAAQEEVENWFNSKSGELPTGEVLLSLAELDQLCFELEKAGESREKKTLVGLKLHNTCRMLHHLLNELNRCPTPSMDPSISNLTMQVIDYYDQYVALDSKLQVNHNYFSDPQSLLDFFNKLFLDSSYGTQLLADTLTTTGFHVENVTLRRATRETANNCRLSSNEKVRTNVEIVVQFFRLNSPNITR